jgi:hypothetical protein
MRHGMKAWLITWDWSGPHAALEDRIAAILSPRLSERHVGEIVEFLFNSRALDVTELALYAKHPRDSPYRAEWHNGFCHCGHNPFLVARRVDDLVVSRDDKTGLETIRWVEPPLFTADLKTLEIKKVRGPLSREVRRTIAGPLSTRMTDLTGSIVHTPKSKLPKAKPKRRKNR